MDIQRTFQFAQTGTGQKAGAASEKKADTSETTAPQTPQADVYSGTAFTKEELARADEKYGWDPSHFTGNGEPLPTATAKEIRNNRAFWRA